MVVPSVAYFLAIRLPLSRIVSGGQK
jgi:hypothetical protein